MRKQRRRSAVLHMISDFVFATRTVQFLFYLLPKFQASSLFLCLYRPVCVRPGQEPQKPVFTRRGSYKLDDLCTDMARKDAKNSKEPEKNIKLSKRLSSRAMTGNSLHRSIGQSVPLLF